MGSFPETVGDHGRSQETRATSAKEKQHVNEKGKSGDTHNDER